MNNIFDQIKAVPIKDVAEKLGIKVLKNNSALCFNHQDKTPSLSFNLKKNLWYCFACDIGGSNIELVQKVLNVDIKTALGWFQNSFNIPTNVYIVNTRKRATIYKTQPVKKLILEEIFYEPNLEIYNFLYSKLSLSDITLDYLKKRGYKEEIIRELNIVDITDTELAFKTLTENWSFNELERCGLAKYDHLKNRYKFNWWGHTIIFPFYDVEGNLVYFQGRSLNPNSYAKYVNLKGLPKPIYNLQIIRSLPKGASIYFFEGITDCIMGVQAGYNSFGILGASGFKEVWTKYFTEFNIFIVPDNDIPGQTFSESIFNAFLKIGKRAHIKKVPKGKDFSDYMHNIIKPNTDVH